MFEGWAIDRDHLEPAGSSAARVGVGQTEAEVGGFHRVTVCWELKASEVIDPVRFRTLDDDGEVYYGGAISRSWIDGEEEKAFGPLAYAQADAGATELQYHYGDGAWKTL